MTKPLHEQLREWVNREPNDILTCLGYEFDCLGTGWTGILSSIVDRIEREYIPRPRYEDDEIIQFDSVVNDKLRGDMKVDRISFTRSGFYFGASHNAKGERIVEKIRYDYGEPVKRPAPQVLGADGVEIKSEDTMFGTGREQHRYTVQKPYSINEEVGTRFCVQCYDHDEDNVVWCDPSMLTHQEPDSLEKLRDAMAKAYEFSGARILGRYVERLTALIERGV